MTNYRTHLDALEVQLSNEHNADRIEQIKVKIAKEREFLGLDEIDGESEV